MRGGFSSRFLLLRLAALLAAAGSAAAAPGDAQRVLLELRTVENHTDATWSSGCIAQDELKPGRRAKSWLSFGRVRPDSAGGWEAISSRTKCGTGSTTIPSARSGSVHGVPYIVLALDARPALEGQEVALKAKLLVRRLSGFDSEGQPAYTHQTEVRSFRLGVGGEAIIPVLLSDEREREAFGVHEVLLRLSARALLQEPAASYGAISVAADIPGAEVLLDGGSVGRIAEDRPILLRDVLTGSREVRVRDHSGREARHRVLVEEGTTAEVRLEVLHLAESAGRDGLVALGPNPQGFQEYWRLKDRVTVVRIPAGEFPMGSAEEEGEPRERPRHTVFVSEFLIDKTQVTWRQFRKFSDATGTPLPPAPAWGRPDDFPASNLTWEDARAYCEWVGGRLPTEAEWEKTARGTDGRRYPWGDRWESDRCNSWVGGPHRPMSVGAFPGCTSPYGVLDIAGSMWDWCADWYGEDYYAKSPSADPQGPGSGTARVLRGGDWISQTSLMRTAYRHSLSPSSYGPKYGVRCAQEAPE